MPSHHTCKCWLFSWTLRNKLQWNFNQNFMKPLFSDLNELNDIILIMILSSSFVCPDLEMFTASWSMKSTYWKWYQFNVDASKCCAFIDSVNRLVKFCIWWCLQIDFCQSREACASVNCKITKIPLWIIELKRAIFGRFLVSQSWYQWLSARLW